MAKPEFKTRQLPDYLILFAKGMAMGAADIVPGVSGGTVAFITHIYDELLESIRQFRPSLVPLLFTQGLSACWRQVNGNFLLTLVLGIALSVLSLGRVIAYHLEHSSVLLGGFFFGLIAASVVYMVSQQTRWSLQEGVALVLGTVCVLLMPAKPMMFDPNLFWVFAAGAVAVCAMILPGVSGSFILLMLGMYPVILNALKDFNVTMLSVFVAGCVFGLLGFSHLLTWLLRRFHSQTLAVLTGFLLGSLSIIWPWKEVLESGLDRHGKPMALLTRNVVPWDYQALGLETPIGGAVLLAILGFALVFGLERIGSNSPKT